MVAKKLTEKTASIVLGTTEGSTTRTGGRPPLNTPAASSSARPAHTGVGLVMSAIVGKDETQKRLNDAEAKLAEFEGAAIEQLLDPTLINPSRWANRDESEWQTDSFKEFKDELIAAGGNVQAIKVRRIGGVFYGKTPQYEIVFGHRRHRACLEAGLQVKAIVVDDMSDMQLFAEMDRENRCRKNLSGLEQGRMYANALKEGLFPSLRQLAASLNLNLSNTARAVQLAGLPPDVVRAFPSPLDLQVRWAKALTDAVQRDPDGVLAVARELIKGRGSLTATEVFNRLIGQTIAQNDRVLAFSKEGKEAGRIKSGPKGRAVVEFEPGVLPVERHAALIQLIEGFLTDEDESS